MPTTTEPTRQGAMSRPGQAEYIGLLAGLMALAALGIDMMLPAFDRMRVSFGLEPASTAVAQTVTTYFVGMALAQLVFGPLSDRVGRRRVIFVGAAIYVFGAVGSALSPTLGILLAFRFVWGVGAAASTVVVTAIVRDSFVGDAMASMMSTLLAVFLLVPILAPTLGAAVVSVAPWRAVFWLIAGVGTVVAGLAAVRLPETLPIERRTPIRVDVLRQSVLRVFTNEATLLPLMAVTVLQAVFTSYLGSSELIIGEIFGLRSRFALVFGATAAIFGLASLANGRLVRRFGMIRLLRPAVACYLIGSAVLLVIALGSDGRPRFWVYYPVLAVLLGSSMILRPNLNTMALVPLGDIAGTASSIIGAVSLATGALVGAIIDSLLDDSVTPFSVALVISAALTGLLVLRISTIGEAYR